MNKKLSLNFCVKQNLRGDDLKYSNNREKLVHFFPSKDTNVNYAIFLFYIGSNSQHSM
jgi:hypothetical protein